MSGSIGIPSARVHSIQTYHRVKGRKLRVRYGDVAVRDLLMFCQWTGFASAHRRLPLRANPRARQCPPVSIDARLSQRSLRAPSGAATQQIGPPTRAPAGCGPTDARHRHSRRVHSHHGHRAAKPASAPSRVGHRHVRKDVHFADLMASRLLLRSARQQRQRRARSLCH